MEGAGDVLIGAISDAENGLDTRSLTWTSVSPKRIFQVLAFYIVHPTLEDAFHHLPRVGFSGSTALAIIEQRRLKLKTLLTLRCALDSVELMHYLSLKAAAA